MEINEPGRKAQTLHLGGLTCAKCGAENELVMCEEEQRVPKEQYI